MRIAGVDGCKGGWICITRDLVSREISSEVVKSISSLLDRAARPVVLAIDIPIGLPQRVAGVASNWRERYSGGRAPAASFPPRFAPPLSRAIAGRQIRLRDRWTAGVWARKPGVSIFARGLDWLLTADATARGFTYEVQPEVSFTAWNGGAAIVESKKSKAGMAIRRRLIDSHFGKNARNAVRREQPRSLAADDDINDAFAALWTAARIYSGSARVVPDPPEIDPNGIAMGIWY